MKRAFLVLGAQRSGTSAVSHLLSKFGVDFGNPNHFIHDAHNPIFFELEWVNRYNDQLIQALGYQYTDYFLPTEEDFNRIASAIAVIEQKIQLSLTNEWYGHPCIGIKDPRICLTFPAWQKLLQANHYHLNLVFVFRSPANFLASNQELFQDWRTWNDAKHLKFWLQLNSSILYFTRHCPVHFVHYEHLIADPLGQAYQLANSFDFDHNLVYQAATVVNRSHHHHHNLNPTGYAFIDQVYQRLCEQARSPLSKNSQDSIEFSISPFDLSHFMHYDNAEFSH